MADSPTIEITREEYDRLQAVKDELHARKNSEDVRVRCEHTCEHGHKPISLTADERRKQVAINAEIDRKEKETRLAAEERRLDALLRAGRISRDEKSRILQGERERMGL